MRNLLVVALVLVPAAAFAQPNFETAKAVAVDADTLKTIEAKTVELRAAVAAVPRAVPPDVRADAAVYLKAAEWIVRHGEFLTKESPKQTLAVIDAGLARAAAAAKGQAPWRAVRGKPVALAYTSAVDGSIQPYSVLLPAGFETSDKARRIDVVLHGRDGTLTEVKFLAGKEAAKADAKTDHVVIEVYGRGNNAYRWAGERDVFEALADFRRRTAATVKGVEGWPVVLRGFSMGGAGAWHLGLHHPSAFAAVSPGAGFTTTRGYIKNLPALPDYQERTLHVYDAVDYAENTFNVPIVAYSGEKDGQKAAADNIEKALKGFPEPLRFTHLVAPGLEHKQPAEWLAKIEAEFQKYVTPGSVATPSRVRFVTYTLRYPSCGWVALEGLERHYDRTVVDAEIKAAEVVAKTTNVSRLRLTLPAGKDRVTKVTLDGQPLAMPDDAVFEKAAGKWAAAKPAVMPRKVPGLQGPIDDVFHTPFRVSGPTVAGWSDETSLFSKACMSRFNRDWDKHFRGLPIPTVRDQTTHSEVLFGDPCNNRQIGSIYSKLPFNWTQEKLIMNGVEYDSRDHLPALIYPHPKVPGKYCVLNCGHSFGDADLKGTNALLYPRLGDWAVLKLKPTKENPTVAEVVAAGIFDENWQFAK